MSTQIILPRILEIGAGASRNIGAMVKDINCQRPLIVTDKIMLQLGYVQRVRDDLSAMNIDSDVFDETVPEPTTRSIEAGVELVKNGQYDVIIGLGGGSPIDSAKAISILGK